MTEGINKKTLLLKVLSKEMDGFKVMYIGDTRPLELTHGRVYIVTAIERQWYRIETDALGDYLYPPELFEVLS